MSETPTYILIPGCVIPSRELLAILHLLPFHRHMIETATPEPGWICSPSFEPFRADAWTWTQHEDGYWVASTTEPSPAGNFNPREATQSS